MDRVPCVFVENGKVAGLDPADPIEVNYQKPFPGLPLGRTHPELLTLRATHGHDMAIVNIQGIQDLALREGPWKFIPPGQRDVRDGLDAVKQTRQQVSPPGLLFNLAADPAEQDDLSAREPERVAAMEAKLEQLRHAPGKP